MYANETCSVFISPLFIIAIIIFNNETQIPSNYDIRSNDLIYYLLFSIIIILFQMTVDVFLLNVQEIFHGWPIYAYMEFAKHRFANRTVRWKGHDNRLDETLNPALQSIDQLCFSSQFYFVNGFFAYGLIFVILGITMLLRQAETYNPFSDPLTPVVIAFVVFTALVMGRTFVMLADTFGLWNVSASVQRAVRRKAKKETGKDTKALRHQYHGELVGKVAQLEHIMALHERVENKKRQAEKLPRVPLAILTRATVRERFFNKNAPWLLTQLPTLLTPRSLEEHREFLTENYRTLMEDDRVDISSDSDDDRPQHAFKEVEVTPVSREIAIFWLQRARTLVRRAHLVHAIKAEHALPICQQCGRTDLLEVMHRERERSREERERH